MKCELCGSSKNLYINHFEQHLDKPRVITICKSCHAAIHNLPLRERLEKKIERLKRLLSCLDEEIRDATDIAKIYYKKFCEKIDKKVCFINLLELYVWTHEGKLNSKVR